MSRPTEPTVQVSDDLPGRPLIDASGANAGSADPVAKHTPGPWELEFSTWPGDAAPRGFGIIADGKWHSVASTSFHEHTNSACFAQDELVANARLIAAAPDLLEALTVLADSIEGAWPSLSHLQPLLRARAAIAKATAPHPAPSSAETGDSGMNNSNNSEA